MIPSSRPKLFDLYTLSQSKLLEKHTLPSWPHGQKIQHRLEYFISFLFNELRQGEGFRIFYSSMNPIIRFVTQHCQMF